MEEKASNVIDIIITIVVAGLLALTIFLTCSVRINYGYMGRLTDEVRKSSSGSSSKT